MSNLILAGIRMAASLAEALTSGSAIIVYVAVLLVLVTVLVIAILVNEPGKEDEAEQKVIVVPT